MLPIGIARRAFKPKLPKRPPRKIAPPRPIHRPTRPPTIRHPPKPPTIHRPIPRPNIKAPRAPKIKLPERQINKNTEKHHVIYTGEDIIKIFGSSENLKHFAILFFLSFTGIKTNMAIEVTLRDLDLDNNIIYITIKNEKIKSGCQSE